MALCQAADHVSMPFQDLVSDKQNFIFHISMKDMLRFLDFMKALLQFFDFLKALLRLFNFHLCL